MPYSIANVGPGFDRLGLCLDGACEWAAFAPGRRGFRLTVAGNPLVPRTPRGNVAAVALRWTARRLGAPEVKGQLTLVKRTGAGSGLGSSGASALAGALLGARQAGADLADRRVVETVLHGAAVGERIASGTAHYDNVAASLFGGLVLIESLDPLRIHRVDPGSGLHIAVATPADRVATRTARQVVPNRIPREDAVANLGSLGALLLGVVRRDPRSIGRALTDRIAEPYRASLVPGYRDAVAAARAEGAWGVALAGSGPSVFAIAPARCAKSVARAMAEAFDRRSPGAKAWVTGTGRGARFTHSRSGRPEPATLTVSPARSGPTRSAGDGARDPPHRGI
ncbi:MAG: homoserine kinase [Thermoplasmata archaeon]